ncbi:hypothetical protein [Aquidulcibacter sp.]|nr:hypothetical protein [Aquidulcibacter sp.]
MEAAIAGMGVRQLPEFHMSAALRSKELVEVFPDFRSSEEPIWAVYP